MNKFKQFALNHPLLFGVLLLILYPALAFLAFPIRYLFPGNEVGQLYSDAFAKLFIFFVILAILWRFGWIRASGLTRIRGIRIWPVIAGILIYHLVVDLYVFTGEITIVTSNSPLGFANLVYYLPASLFEETAFRGLLLLAMVYAWGNTKASLVKAVIFSSLFFGLIHLYNLAEKPAGVVVFQATSAAMLGILWAGIVIAARSLWPTILLHWLTNAAVNIQLIRIENFQETYGTYLSLSVLFIPLAVLGGYLVWNNPETFDPGIKLAATPGSSIRIHDGYQETT